MKLRSFAERDPGVRPNIYEANAKKFSSDSDRADDDKFVDAIDELLSKGCKHMKFLGSLRKARINARGHSRPTAKQLDALNALRVKHDLPKISVAVYDKNKRRIRFENFKRDTNEWFDSMKAALPKKPPGR